MSAESTKTRATSGDERERCESTRVTKVTLSPGVFITFDVECSMGGAWRDERLKPVTPERAIWGRFGDQELGIPLLVKTLDENGLKGTFFVDAFTDDQGYPGQMEPVCHYLLDRGHDVQLHVHPNKKHYGMKMRGEPHPRTDRIADLDANAQLALIEEGAERIRRWTGSRPVAFRAGNMAASEETLRQLESAGILIDSSYTFPYSGGQCRFQERDDYNGSRWYGGVLELALSGVRFPRLPGLHPAQPLDLVGMSFPECRDAVQSICTSGADVVWILHSFSLFKWRTVQYDGGRLNRIVARRYRAMCRWLGENAGQFPCRTFREVAVAISEGRYRAASVAPGLLANPLRSYMRRGVQVWNNLYWT